MASRWEQFPSWIWWVATISRAPSQIRIRCRGGYSGRERSILRSGSFALLLLRLEVEDSAFPGTRCNVLQYRRFPAAYRYNDVSEKLPSMYRFDIWLIMIIVAVVIVSIIITSISSASIISLIILKYLAATNGSPVGLRISNTASNWFQHHRRISNFECDSEQNLCHITND